MGRSVGKVDVEAQVDAEYCKKAAMEAESEAPPSKPLMPSVSPAPLGGEAQVGEDERDDAAGAAGVLHAEGSVRRRCWSIAQGAAVGAAAYSAVSAAVGGDAEVAEDIVDLGHSVYTSSVAIWGISSLRRHPEHVVSLPTKLARDDGEVVRMFCRSIGYFFGDVALIFGERFVFGRSPHMWAGRLAHHAIQAFANLTCSFRTERTEQTIALRTVLCIAYFAEFSNIFLRLSNLLRRKGGSSQSLRAMNVTLLLSFLASRMVNFPFAIYVFWRARRHISRDVLWTIFGVQASGYLLNLAWFGKIIKILMKPSRTIPSIEC